MRPDHDAPWYAGDRAAKVCRWLLDRAARRVPPPRRRAWRDEWEGELWALRERGRRWPTLLAFAASGAMDARRESGEGTMTTTVLDETRQALRTLRRSPGLVAVTTAVLAVGIGVNAAIFSVMRAALLDTGAVHEPERLHAVDLTLSESGGDAGAASEPTALPFSWPAYRTLRENLPGEIELAGFTSRQMTLLDAGDPVRIGVEVVTPGYFEVLGVEPVLGRLFDASEAPPADAPVALLSNATWRTRFGADRAVLGRTVRLNGAAVTVVGVLPADFAGLTGQAEAWVSMALAPEVMDARRLERALSFWFYAVARTPDGAAASTFSELFERAGHAVADAVAEPGMVMGARVVPFTEARVNEDGRLSLLVVTGAALLLLLVACANVGGLLVARAATRRGDTAVRAALGAGRGRLLRAPLLESLAISLLGGAAGIALATLGVGWLARWLPHAIGTTGTRRLRFLDPEAVTVDGTVLLFGLAASLATGVLAGLWPALRAARTRTLHGTEGLEGLRTAGRGVAGSAGRSVLVAAQLALAVVLMAGTGLMLGSLAELNSVDTGVRADDALLANYELDRETPDEEVVAFHRTLLERVGALAGVESATLSQCTPLSGSCDVTLGESVESERAGGDPVPLATVIVDDAYFEAFGIPLLAGRTFDANDRGDTEPVVVLSRGAADVLFPAVRTGGASPGERVLGERVTASIGRFGDEAGARVVGVVDDVLHDSDLTREPMAAVYVGYRQLPVGYMTLTVRSSGGDPLRLTPAVRSAALELAPELPLSDVRSLEEQIRAVSARTRVVLALLGLFAATALALAALGVYGLVAFTVARRTPELGLRMALGASPNGVVARVVGRAAVVAVAGVAVGLGAALALSRVMEALLFGVRPGEPAVMAGASLGLVLVAVLSAWVPARRATRIDPAGALRVE